MWFTITNIGIIQPARKIIGENHANLKNQINHSSDNELEKLSELGLLGFKDYRIGRIQM